MNPERAGLLQRYDALSLRERVLVALTLVVLQLFLWWMLFYEPVAPEVARLQQANERLETEVASLRSARDGIRKRLDEGVHRRQQERVQALERELALLKQELAEGTDDLVAPRQMFTLMRQMIDAAPGLRLLELRRSAVEPLFRTDDAEAAESGGKDAGPGGEEEETAEQRPGLYRHVMELRLEGRYGDILDWLQQLEALPWQLMWNRVELKSGDYPRIEVALTLSTVSASRAWVGL
jgi:MSHA biogenesis protein MshJ